MSPIFGYVVLAVGYVFTTQALVGWVVSRMFASLLREAKSIKEEFPQNEELEQEYKNLLPIQTKKKRLGYLTKIVGVFELIIFAFSTFLLVQKNQLEIYNTVSVFLPLFAGWVAIKIVGNYGQWSGAVFGRASFYIFFIGTILNTTFGVILGLAFYSLTLF